MKRFQYWRILTGARHLTIWRRGVVCTVECPSREAFVALVAGWNMKSKDWLFVSYD